MGFFPVELGLGLTRSMVVEVVPRLGNKVSRALSGSSLVGDGMLIRLRSSTLGILGLVAAAGLGLIAFASLQGWPGAPSGPLPQAPGPDFLRNDPIVAPRGAAGAGADAPRLALRPASKGRRSQPTRPEGASALTDAQQVNAGASQPQPSPTPQPSPSPAPTADESQPAPASTTPTVESTPVNARPSTDSGGSTPVAAGGDESPGRSGGGHGSHHGSGPPAWAGTEKESDPPGHGSSDGDQHGGWGHDDRGEDRGHGGHGGGWGHH